MSETDREIVGMLADERGLSAEKISPSSRLLHDLGMDGDDAVEFFQSLQERYGTDLTNLYQHWGDYFGPEGFSCWNGLIILPAAVAGGVVAGLLDLGAMVGFLIAVVLLVAWYWAIHRVTPDPLQPITVAEVVSAAEAGAWPDK